MRLSYQPHRAIAISHPADCNIYEIINPLFYQPRKSVALDMFDFELYSIVPRCSRNTDSKIEILLIAISKVMLGPGLVPNKTLSAHGGSWLTTKLTNTPAIMNITMRNASTTNITSFTMDGDGTLGDLRDRMEKVMKACCLQRRS